MGNMLSVHYIPTHFRPEDIDYFRSIQPNVMKFVDADANAVRQVYDVLPADTLFFLRDWALSEQKEDMQTASRRRRASAMPTSGRTR